MVTNQQQAASDPYNFPIQQPHSQMGDSAFLYQLNTTDIVDELKHALRGEVYDDTKRAWTRVEGNKCRLNERGISDVINLAHMVVNRNTFLSEVNPEQIEILMTEFHQDLAQLFFTNWEDYGIPKQLLNVVTMQILGFMYLGLKRAEAGKTLKALTKIQQVIERIDQQPREKKSFGIGRIFGGGEK